MAHAIRAHAAGGRSAGTNSVAASGTPSAAAISSVRGIVECARLVRPGNRVGISNLASTSRPRSTVGFVVVSGSGRTNTVRLKADTTEK